LAFKEKPTMAKKPAEKVDDGSVKARVIVAGLFGSMNDVVVLDKAAAAAAQATGDIDTHPDAVAYAESLKG
jgi:hypothetical protein